MTPLMKNTILAPVYFCNAILDRLVSVTGALILCQYPQFKILYLQRLGGHVDELARILKAYTLAASSMGFSLQQYIEKHLGSGAQEFRETGRIMAENAARYRELTDALSSISGATPHLSIFSFLRHCDMAIAGETVKNFTPGIPLTPEALIYGLAGMITAMFLYWLIKKSLQTLLGAFSGGMGKGRSA